jgi:NAD(P)-dependent dehydrogenase (short-subunit alcohol dehydrogenase family)
MKSLNRKIALVTGASRGIGFAVAKRFIDEGAKVIAVARSIKGMEELDDYARSKNSSITIAPLDLKDGNKIDQLGYNIHKKFGYLDVLVGNAAMFGDMSPLAHYAPAKWQDVMDVNLTANWRLIRSLDPLLRLSKAGRVIMVTAGVAQDPGAYYGAYAVSKAALEALVKIYSKETEATNIRVNLVSPENVVTKLKEEEISNVNKSSFSAPEDIAELFVRLASDDCDYSSRTLRNVDIFVEG